jgi:hypothetical protein
MTDYLFDEILNRRAHVTRPAVPVGADGLAGEPIYSLVGSVALRVRPVRASLDASLLGAWPAATVVAYLEPGVVQALDRVAVVVTATALAAAASAGLTAIGLEEATGLQTGSRLQLTAAADFFETVVETIADTTVTLRDALPTAFPAGASVEAVTSYEVLGVEDAAGAGHHVRAGMRQR